jgi:hypothetical protein
MLVWGFVSSEIEHVIEFFGTRQDAERALDEILRDDDTRRPMERRRLDRPQGCL